MAGLQATHTRHQRVVIGDGAPAHQRRDHGDACDFGKLLQQVGGIGVDDAATGHDQRALGRVQHLQGFLDLLARRSGLVNRQRLVGVDIEFNFTHLHVKRQINQHRAGAARPHQMKRLLEGARHLGRLHHRGGPFGHRLGDAGDVHRLEVFLVHTGARRLAGDAQNRDRIGLCRVQAGDHVGAGWAAGADADADVAGPGPRVTLGHVGGAFNVARQHVGNCLAFAQLGIQRVDGGAGHAKHLVNTFFFHHQHGGHGGLHLCHCFVSSGQGFAIWNPMDGCY